MNSKSLILVFAALSLSAVADAQICSQPFCVVSGTNVSDASGKPVTGTIIFQPTDSNGNPLPFRIPSTGQVVPTLASAPITAGAFSLNLADTTQTSPPNFCYRTYVENSYGKVVLGSNTYDVSASFQCVQMDNTWCSGDACNFNNYNSGSSPSGAAGTVTSVGITVPNWLTVSPSTITTSGTFAVTAAGSQAANKVLASPNGSAGAVSLRSLVVQDLPTGYLYGNLSGAPSTLPPSGTASGDLSGSYPGPTVAKINGNTVPANAAGFLSNNGSGVLSWVAAGGSGTVTSFSAAVPSWLTQSVATPTTTPALTIGAASAQTSHQVIGTCGTATSFAPCSLVVGDLPTGYLYSNLSGAPSALPPNGSAGGDLSSTYPNPTVAKVDGTSVPTNSAADTVLGTTAAATGAWISIVNCVDSAGNHLNYTTATHTFSCGNTGTGGGFSNPMSALGDLIYGGASGTATRFPGYTTANTAVLTQTGTGTVSAAPVWSNAPALSAANMSSFPTLNQNTTGNAATATSATTATNLAGGAVGAVPYQSAANTTALLSGNTAATDQVLVSHGTGSVAQAPTLSNAPALSAANMTSFPTFNQNTTGSAASFTGSLAGDVTGTQSATVVGKINGVSLAGLATGILKNTTTTGHPSIAAAGTDYQAPITLTTTGTSGAATLISNTLNIPQYAGGGGSGTVNSGTANQIAIYAATGTAVSGDSALTDSGTTLSYSGTGGVSAPSYSTNATTPGAFNLVAGTGSIAALPSNSAGFAAPTTGGTSYLFKLPATASAGILFAAAPATADGVNESAWSFLTAPAGTIVGTSDTQTLTNKTISGSSNTLTNIGNGSLTNSSTTVAGQNCALGSSCSIASTNLSDSSILVRTTDTGTVTNTMLAGSIANGKLSNSAVTVNGASISLGSSAVVSGGVNVYTANQTLSTSDNGKLVIANCSAACAITLPTTQPSTSWYAKIMTVGSTNATIALGGSDTFNGSTSVPVLNKYRPLLVHADTTTSTNYYGDAPLIAGTNLAFSNASNGLTVNVSGLAASATTDTTNASNISSGTLNAARLPAALSSSTSVNGTSIPSSATLATAPSTLTAGGILYGGGTTVVDATSAGTTKQIVLSGGSSAPTMIDFPDVKVIPAANCVSSTAGSGWNTTLTPSCIAGTNNLGGSLPFVDTSTAQFEYEIPGDWDTSSEPYFAVFFNSGTNTSGTVIFNVAVACTKSDGSVSSDPSFQTADAATTKTMAAATRMWSTSVQSTQVTTANSCVAGGTMLVKITRATDTAATAVNVTKATITFPRLLAVQAN